METIMDRKHRPFVKRDLWAYAMGDFGCNMSFALKNTITIFYTLYIGLSAETVALIILLLNIWDGINDPIVGAIMDRKKPGKYGKFKPFVMWGSLALVFSGAMVFLPIPKADPAVKIIVCILGYLIWDMAYTVVNVPYGSMASVITDDPVERAGLSKFRTIGSMLAQLPIMVGLPFVIYRDRLDEAGNIVKDPVTGEKIQDLLGFNVFLVALILGFVGLLAFYIFLKNTVERVEAKQQDQPKEKVSYLGVLKSFFSNRAAIGVTFASIFSLVMMQGLGTANAVLFKDYFKNAELSGIIQMISFLPGIAGIFVCDPLVRRYGKKAVAGLPFILGIIGGFLMMVVKVPANTIGLVIWIALQMLVSVSFGMFTVLCWAMVSDCIDYQEVRTGRREEGTVYAIYSLGRKVAQGLGAAVVLLFMGWLGFVSAENGITPTQTPEVVNRIRILIGAVQFVCCLGQFVFLTFVYNLDKKKVQEIQEKLGRVNNNYTINLED